MAKGNSNEPEESGAEQVEMEAIDAMDDNAAMSHDEIQALLAAMSDQNDTTETPSVAPVAPAEEPAAPEESSELVAEASATDESEQDFVEVHAEVLQETEVNEEPAPVAELPDEPTPESEPPAEVVAEAPPQEDVALEAPPAVSMEDVLRAASESTSMSVEEIMQLETEPEPEPEPEPVAELEHLEVAEEEPSGPVTLESLLESPVTVVEEPAAPTTHAEKVVQMNQGEIEMDNSNEEVTQEASAKKKLSLPKVSFKSGWFGMLTPILVSLVGAAGMSLAFQKVMAPASTAKTAKVEKTLSEIEGTLALHSEKLSKIDDHFEATLASAPAKSDGKSGHGDQSTGHATDGDSDDGHNGNDSGQHGQDSQSDVAHDPSHDEHKETGTAHEDTPSDHESKQPTHGQDEAGHGDSTHKEPSHVAKSDHKNEDQDSKSHSKSEKHTIESHGAEGFDIPGKKSSHKATKPEHAWTSSAHEVHMAGGAAKRAKTGHNTSSGHRPSSHKNSQSKSSHAKLTHSKSGHGKAKHGSKKPHGGSGESSYGSIKVYLEGRPVTGDAHVSAHGNSASKPSSSHH